METRISLYIVGVCFNYCWYETELGRVVTSGAKTAVCYSVKALFLYWLFLFKEPSLSVVRVYIYIYYRNFSLTIFADSIEIKARR